MEMYTKSGMLTHIICMTLQVETMKITVVYVITNGGIHSKYAYASTKIIGSLMPFSFESSLKNIKEIL